MRPGGGASKLQNAVAKLQSSPTVRAAGAYGKAPLVALACMVALDSGERLSLSQAAHGIKHAFHVSDFAIGALPVAMAFAAAPGAVPFGILADKRRRTFVLAVAAVLWSFFIGLNAVATSFLMLFIVRMGLGAVEASGPASISLISDYYPAKDRGRMLSMVGLGGLVGAMVGLIGGGIAVTIGGWRAAFVMWIPAGVLVGLFVARQPEPRRGEQDAHFGEASAAAPGDGLSAADVADSHRLPPPRRTGTLDYERCTNREVWQELRRIPTMWYGAVAVTVGNLCLVALTFWAVEYFKRTHHLNPTAAGSVAGLLGGATALGFVGGGFLCDRLLARGVLAARVHVVAASSIVAPIFMMPAFASTHLGITVPFMFLGGVTLTLAIAPADAFVNDVVVGQLRGRAATVRSVVRSVSSVGALLVGGVATLLENAGVSNADGLRWAIVATLPLLAVGGLIALFAVRTYPADVAFVVAESHRINATTGEASGDGGAEPSRAKPSRAKPSRAEPSRAKRSAPAARPRSPR